MEVQQQRHHTLPVQGTPMAPPALAPHAPPTRLTAAARAQANVKRASMAALDLANHARRTGTRRVLAMGRRMYVSHVT